MEGKKEKKNESRVPQAFRTGAIALAFLVVGYEAALFVQKAAVARVVANSDHPDTVYVTVERSHGPATSSDSIASVERRPATHAPEVQHLESLARPRKVETFSFNPNTASLRDFMRLGFSERQAQSILNYREKGGRFRRKADFAKSFVVADSVYKRLEPYISIPKVEINSADSAAFDALPGIGGYFARKMVEYRELLGGYSCTEQLLEIYNFGQERYDALKDLVSCKPAKAYPFWTASEEQLRKHPHIRSARTAHAIVLYRENNPRSLWTLHDMEKAGVLGAEQSAKLSRCNLEPPGDVSP